MEETTNNEPAPRRRGRPRKSIILPTEEAGPALTGGIPDDELEQYGGDIAALDSVGGRRERLARRSAYRAGHLGLLDLNAPGTLVRRDTPDLTFHFAWWDDNHKQDGRVAWVTMTQKGYQPAMKDDWIVAPELRTVVCPDDSGRLTLGASKDGAMVVMYQSVAAYREAKRIDYLGSDYIQQTAEQRANELQEEAARAGLTGLAILSRMEDDRESANYFKR